MHFSEAITLSALSFLSWNAIIPYQFIAITRQNLAALEPAFWIKLNGNEKLLNYSKWKI